MEKINYINIQHLDNLNLEIKNKSDIKKDKVIKLERSKKHDKRIDGFKLIDNSSKVVSLIAGIGLITILVLVLLDIKQIGKIDIGNLLTIISVTFVGGLFSIGGINLFNLQTALKKQKKEFSDIQQYIQKSIDTDFISLTQTHRAWCHYFIPNKNIALVFGHEHPAKIYSTNNTYKEFKCIWDYNENVNQDVHFAQSGNYYKDKYFALGDYGTGVATIYLIDKKESFSFRAIKGRIDFVEFSENGKYIAIASENNNIHQICIHDLSSRQNMQIDGYGPIKWSSNDELFFMQDTNKIARWKSQSSQIDTIIEDKSVNKFAVNNQLIIYKTVSYDNKTLIKCLDLENKQNTEIFSENFEIELLELSHDKLFITTSYNSKINPNKLYVIDLSGDELFKIYYHSGYGHGYKKFSTYFQKDSVYLTTVGKNLNIPVVKDYKINNKTLINCREISSPKLLGNHFVSVHINAKEEKIYLSALNENGNLMIVNLEEKTPHNNV